MKKNLLLALSMAGAIVVSASVTDRNAVRQELPVKLQHVQVDRQVHSVSAFGKTFAENMRLAPATSRPGTFYVRPRGTFYTGVASSFNGFTVNIIQYGPAFRTWNFTNTTPADNGTVAYEWTYVDPVAFDADPKNPVYLTSAEKNLAVNYFEGFYENNPKLKGTNEIGDSTFLFARYMQAGGGCYEDDKGVYYGTNASADFTRIYNNPSQTGFNSAVANAKAKKYYYENQVDTVKITGIAEYNYAPASPYLLTDMYFIFASNMKGVAEGADIGKVRLTIYKAEQDTAGKVTLGDQLCTSVVAVKQPGKNNYGMVVFNNLTSVDELGLENPLVIDGPMMAVITPEDANISLVPTWRASRGITGEKQAYMLAKVTAGGQEVDDIMNCNWKYDLKKQGSAEHDYAHATAWCFGYNISFEYIHNTEESDIFNAPKEGATKEFKVKARYLSKNPADGTDLWSITDANGEALPDWLTVTVADEIITTAKGKAYTGNSTIKMVAAPLPEGVESRSCNIEFSYPGAKLVLHVNQPGKDADKGDVNADGVVNVSDVTELINVILGTVTDEATKARCYINGDDVINVSDVTELINMILAK